MPHRAKHEDDDEAFLTICAPAGAAREFRAARNVAPSRPRFVLPPARDAGEEPNTPEAGPTKEDRDETPEPRLSAGVR
jgi:hypothetical protein